MHGLPAVSPQRTVKQPRLHRRPAASHLRAGAREKACGAYAFACSMLDMGMLLHRHVPHIGCRSIAGACTAGDITHGSALTHACTCTQMLAPPCGRTHICTLTHTQQDTHKHITGTCTHKHTRTHAHAHAHAHTKTHTPMHAQRHPHTQRHTYAACTPTHAHVCLWAGVHRQWIMIAWL